jgi:hypothetical protein
VRPEGLGKLKNLKNMLNRESHISSKRVIIQVSGLAGD